MVHWLMNVIVAVTVVVGLIGLIPVASASAIHIEYFMHLDVPM